MSTIMKALQRLEAQRKENPPPSLQEEVALRAAQQQLKSEKKSQKKWIFVGIALFLCTAIGFGFLLHRKESTSFEPRDEVPHDVAPAAPSNRAETPSPTFAKAPVLEEESILPPLRTEPVSPSETVSPDRGEFVTRERHTEAPPQSSTSLSVAIAQKSSAAAARQASATQEVAPPPQSTTPAPNLPEPAAAVIPEAPTQKSVDSVTPASDAAVLKSHSPEVPDFRIRRTVWHPQRERRIAVVELMATQEMLNLNEGDTIGTLTVQKITPSRVIFLNGTVEVTRRVGNLP